MTIAPENGNCTDVRGNMRFKLCLHRNDKKKELVMSNHSP